jgi:hypothetical protein
LNASFSCKALVGLSEKCQLTSSILYLTISHCLLYSLAFQTLSLLTLLWNYDEDELRVCGGGVALVSLKWLEHVSESGKS